MKRILRIVGFILLSLILILSVLILVEDEEIPSGKQGLEAENLANKMLESLNKNAFDSLTYLEWNFPGGHHFEWFKKSDSVIVIWGDNKVHLATKSLNGTAFAEGQQLSGEDKESLLSEAWSYFANDSFWLVAPFKIKDPGTIREIVETEEGPALKVTYTSGGVTPGDTYLWFLDEDYKPVKWKMWVSIIPVGGVEMTWDEWKQYQEVWISRKHKGPLSFEMELTNITIQ